MGQGELYRVIFDEGSDALFVLDQELRMLDVNERACALLQESREGLVGRPIREIIDPEDLAAKPMRSAPLGPGETMVFERRLRRKDGTTVDVQVLGRALSNGTYLAVVRHEPERVRKLHRLGLEGKRFRTMVEHAYDGVAIVDLTGALTYVSPALTRITGYSVEEVLGTNTLRLIHPDDLLQARSILERHVTEPGKLFNQEVRVRRKDGGIRRVEVTSVNLVHHEEIGGILAHFHDVTEAREAEDRLRRVLDGSADGYWEIDFELGRSYHSPRIAEMLGYLPGEWVASLESWMSSIHPEDYDRVQDAYGRHVSGEDEVFECEYRLRKKEGKYFWVLDRGRASRRDAHGRALSSAGTITDVTERRRLEEHYRHSQKMESIGRLAGGIAHDFNNLLTVISGYASVLEEQVGPEQRADVEQILAAADQAAALTQQILAFSRKQLLSPTDVDMNMLVRNQLRLIERVIGEDVEIDFIAGKEIGNIFADAGQLEQVLMNLCINARDAMPRGGRLTIETENVLINGSYAKTHPWAKKGRYVLLSVSDTGEGIPEEHLDHIFDPFFTTKPAGKGTGLGLATVYGIIEQHEGMVQVYSELGQGTTFKIYLPIRARAASAIGPKIMRGVVGGNETILVAEDERLVRRLTVRLLTDAGYQTIEAHDGEGAVSAFRANADRVDLVLLDVVMPRISGRAALVEIRKIRPEIPFILTSGYTSEAIGELTEEERQCCISKPFDPEALLRRVRTRLDERKN